MALAAVLGLEAILSGPLGWHPHGIGRYLAFTIGSLLHYAAAVAVIAVLGNTVRQRAGGWARAFGWGPWRAIDLALGAAGAAAEYLARIVVGIALIAVVPSLARHVESNIDLSGRPTPEIALLFILAVAVAPPVEELIFRGVLLRALMKRRLWKASAFWPAALISSVLFAGLHLYEVHGLAARVLLFASTFVFGLGQCLLVRWTGRLGTSITAHALSNAVAAALTLAAGR